MKLLLVTALICISLSASAFGSVKITSKDRVLLVTSNLVTHGQPRYRWLYKFLEGSSVFLARKTLSRSYRKIYLLGGIHATGKNFVDNQPIIANNPENLAMDTLVHLHGDPGALWFYDGVLTTSEIKNILAPQGLKGKARLLYSSACYGESHAQDFVDAGFQVASGSIGVNADSAYAYPATLLKWRRGNSYSSVVRKANNRVSIWISDKAARLMGFRNVNSRKVIKGEGAARIGLAAL